MQRYFAAAILFSLILLVLSRNLQLKKAGIKTMHFGEMDKKDFLIPPFALFFFYIIIASAFQLPTIGTELFHSSIAGWVGVAIGLLGLGLFLYALISFGKSFRVGIDEEHPGELVTTGAFAISRNPIYTAFAIVLCSLFLIIPNWIILIYIILGIWLFNRQIRLEEKSLLKIYGDQYLAYCQKVRRFF